MASFERPHGRYVAYSTASLFALMALGGAALAADISLENVRIQPADDKTSVVLSRVDVRGANLTRAEVEKLFSAATSQEERLEITSRMQASLLSIPEVKIVNTGDEPGEVTISGFAVTNIADGKFERMSVDGLRGQIAVEDSGGDLTLRAGAMTLQDGDLSQLFSSIKAGDPSEAGARFGKFSLANFHARFPEPEAKVFHEIGFGLLEGEGKYDGDVPTVSTGAIRDLVFTPAPESEVGQGMAAFGYNQVKLDVVFSGSYDAAARAYRLNEYTMKGDDTGALTLSGLFGNIGKDVFTGGAQGRVAALMQGGVNEFSLRFDNNGLFDKAVAFYGNMTGAQPDAVRQEWAGLVGGALPMLLGGGSGSLQVASAVGDFIKDARNIRLTVKGKGGTIGFSDLAGIDNPMELMKKIDIDATANQ